MTISSTSATTVLGIDWYVLLFVFLLVVVLLAFVAVASAGSKAASRGRKGRE